MHVMLVVMHVMLVVMPVMLVIIHVMFVVMHVMLVIIHVMLVIMHVMLVIMHVMLVIMHVMLVVMHVMLVVMHVMLVVMHVMLVCYARDVGCVIDGCSTESNNIEDTAIPAQIRGCRLQHIRNNENVHDLKTETAKVQTAIVTFMNRLIEDVGISGFRLAHARHVPSADIEAIVDRLQNVDGKRPFVYHDVVDFSEGSNFDPVRNHEYSYIGRVEEVRAGERLTEMFRGINDRKLADLQTWNNDLEEAGNCVVFIDDAYVLRDVHGRGADTVASHRDRREYETLIALLLSLPYSGIPRILSTYTWPVYLVGGVDINAEWSPPLEPPNILPEGDGCEPEEYGLMCEHRWSALRNMYIFHGLDTIIHPNITLFWTNGDQMVAFSRGHSAFVALNNDVNTLDEKLQTGMEAGDYCDLMTGPERDCNGTAGARVITVDDEGFADVSIPAFDEHPMIVIRQLILP